MILLWGSQLVQIYNDGYREVMGNKHPRGLGQPRRECWPEIWEFNAPIFEKVFERGESLTFENQRLVLERNDTPEEAYFTLSFSPVLDDNGDIGGVLATVLETTAQMKRARVEEALRESDERYRLVGRATNDIIWDWNLKDDSLEWNEAIVSRLGYSKAELGSTIEWWYENIHPEDRSQVLRGIHAAIDGGMETWSDEYRFRNQDGTYGAFLDRGYIARNSAGHAYRMIGSMLDLTERRRMEEALRDSERRIARVLKIETVGVLFFDMQSTFLEANDTFLRMTGLRREALQRGELSSELITLPEWMPRTLQAFKELKANGRFTPYEKELVRPDGTRWWGLFAGAQLSENECVEFVIDITAHKHAEQARYESETRFHAIADLAPDMLWQADPGGQRVWVNRRWTEYTGQSSQEANGYGWMEAIHPYDRNAVLDKYRHAVETGMRFRDEHRMRRSDGSYGWFLVEAVPICNDDGDITHWFGSANDIHDQRMTMDRLEELVAERTQSLAESEERFRLLVTTSAQIIWSTDATGRKAEDSPSWRAFTGQDAESWLKGDWKRVVHPDDVASIERAWQRSTRSGQPYLVEYRLWHARSDNWRWVAARGIPLRDGVGKIVGWFGTNTDIDERKRAEEEVRRMAYSLTMAEQEERRRVSQILHDDLQQLLYALQMKLRMVSNRLTLDRQMAFADMVEETRELIKQAIGTTRQLTVDLSPPILKTEGLADALEWLQRQMLELHGLDVELITGRTMPALDEDLRVLLFQVVRELLFNVKKHAGVDRATVELKQTQQDLIIRVEDQGLGMHKATGAERQGTGFGLSSVRERLRQVGGRMYIESSLGRGMQVIIRVPCNTLSVGNIKE